MPHPLNGFAPFVKYVIVFCHLVNTVMFSYHPVNPVMFSYYPVNSAITLYPVAALFGLKLTVWVENSRLASSFLLSDWLSSSRRGSKSSIPET